MANRNEIIVLYAANVCMRKVERIFPQFPIFSGPTISKYEWFELDGLGHSCFVSRLPTQTDRDRDRDKVRDKSGEGEREFETAPYDFCSAINTLEHRRDIGTERDNKFHELNVKQYASIKSKKQD